MNKITLQNSDEDEVYIAVRSAIWAAENYLPGGDILLVKGKTSWPYVMTSIQYGAPYDGFGVFDPKKDHYVLVAGRVKDYQIGDVII